MPHHGILPELLVSPSNTLELYSIRKPHSAAWARVSDQEPKAGGGWHWVHQLDDVTVIRGTADLVYWALLCRIHVTVGVR